MEKIEFCVLLEHYFLRGKSIKETEEKLAKYYKESAPSHWMVHKLIQGYWDSLAMKQNNIFKQLCIFQSSKIENSFFEYQNKQYVVNHVVNYVMKHVVYYGVYHPNLRRSLRRRILRCLLRSLPRYFMRSLRRSLRRRNFQQGGHLCLTIHIQLSIYKIPNNKFFPCSLNMNQSKSTDYQ